MACIDMARIDMERYDMACIESVLSPQGLAFDALQQCFRTADIDGLMTMPTPPIEWKQDIFIIIDPAAGGPQSDFALLSMTRTKGIITVSQSAHHEATYVILTFLSNSSMVISSRTRNCRTRFSRNCCRKRLALCGQIFGNPFSLLAFSLSTQ